MEPGGPMGPLEPYNAGQIIKRPLMKQRPMPTLKTLQLHTQTEHSYHLILAFMFQHPHRV